MTTSTARSGAVQIDSGALRDLLDSDHPPKVIDVRSPAEFEAVHIPGSHNVPLDTVRARRAELTKVLDSDTVLVCRSGPRAEQAERDLAGAGVAGARVLAGGVSGWEATGGSVEKGKAVWDVERQVRFTAGSLVVLGVLSSPLVHGLKWFSAAIGFGLVFSAASNTCAMGNLLSRMPWNRTASYDADAVLARLAG